MSANTYWLSDGGQVTGPFAPEQIRNMWNAGHITAASLLCQDGSERWEQARPLIERWSQVSPLPRTQTVIVEETKSDTISIIAKLLVALIGFGIIIFGIVSSLGK
jgi:hypothetical protein